MLTQPTPPDDDPSGEPLPVEPAAEQGEAVEQGPPPRYYPRPAAGRL